MIRKYFFLFLALGGFVVAAYTVVSRHGSTENPRHAPDSFRVPVDAPVRGVGLVEASTQNIAIGTPVSGVVAKVYVAVGDRVDPGDPLFTIDDRAVEAELAVRRETLQAAEQAVSRLQSMPRPEAVVVAEAKVADFETQFRNAETQLANAQAAGEAIARGEVSKREYAAQESRARLEEARAELALLKAGAWTPDIDAARAQVRVARAQVHATEVDLERLTVRAPIEGEVLQVSIRVGEFAPSAALATPLMILGDTQRLYVRVDIDEYDAWRVRPNIPARGSLRGNRAIKFDLSFVRIEPYIVPKKSLTGGASERVDTRVLQVLYSFSRGDLPVYVGEQMDVVIDAAEPGGRR